MQNNSGIEMVHYQRESSIPRRDISMRAHRVLLQLVMYLTENGYPVEHVYSPEDDMENLVLPKEVAMIQYQVLVDAGFKEKVVLFADELKEKLLYQPKIQIVNKLPN